MPTLRQSGVTRNAAVEILEESNQPMTINLMQPISLNRWITNMHSKFFALLATICHRFLNYTSNEQYFHHKKNQFCLL